MWRFVSCVDSVPRIQLTSPLRVDPVVPHTELMRFDPDVPVSAGDVSYAPLSVSGECHDVTGLDKPSRVLRVKVLLLEGLCGTTVASSPMCQPHILDVLYVLFMELLENPGNCCYLSYLPTFTVLKILQKSFY